MDELGRWSEMEQAFQNHPLMIQWIILIKNQLISKLVVLPRRKDFFSEILNSMNKEYHFTYREYESEEDLHDEDRELLIKAREATAYAYAPYSKFYVGAAGRLISGKIITGVNQENASFPAGNCAERSLLNVASSLYPGEAIEVIAISYSVDSGITSTPVSPCGVCRQALLEFELRTGRPIRLILSGMEGPVMVIDRSSDLLPMGFNGSQLKNPDSF